MSLPQLSLSPKCVKCGNESAEMRHMPPIDAIGCKKLGIDHDPDFDGIPEHMLRGCTRCQFRWRELPLDAPAQLSVVK